MKRKYKLFIVSLFLVNLYLWVFWGEFVYGFPNVLKYILTVLIFSIIIYYWYTNRSKPDPGQLFYPAVLLFVAWSLVMIIAVILNPHSELWPDLSFPQRVLGQPDFFLPYIIPLFILFTRFDIDFFADLFRYASIIIVLAIIVQLLTIMSGISVGDKEQQSRVLIFNLGSSFLLLISHFSKRKYVFYVALLYTLLMVFLFAQWGRRAMLLDTILVLFTMILIRLRTILLNFYDRIKIYYAALILFIMIISYGQIAKSTYVFERGFSKEAREQTRGFVYEAFFLDFSSTSDWILGRGIGGTILRSERTGGQADFVESGFLNLLFKGGLFYLIPFLILLLRAVYLGLGASKNDLVKALAFLIIIHIISMYAWNWPELSSKYIFLWIAVGACFNTELRNATNEIIYRKINCK